jgi:hypothetical protein
MAKRVPVVERPRKKTFECMTADGGTSGWSSGGTSTSRCRGSCGGVACVAASGSPTIPPFALPRKRFTKPPVLEKATEYLGTEHSYARTTEHEEERWRLPIMYDDRNAQGRKLPEGLAPSTVWRWLSWLGSMPATLRATWDLLRQKEPNATLHRQAWEVASGKYRSPERRDTLIEAMQLLAADRVCKSIFGQGIFPRYAISQGWS